MANAIPVEIDIDAFETMSHDGRPYRLLDVREPWEREVCSFEDSLNIPMGELPTNVSHLPRQEDLVVVCHHGVRSFRVMEWLRANGFDNATSLRGGIDAWARTKDPSMGVY